MSDVAAVLLEFDANPNVLDEWHWSPLDVAQAQGFADIGEMIIESGGVNGPKMSIHDAATIGDNDMVALHLFFGTDLNLLSDTGATPLDAAALGPLLGVGAVLGDLVESVLKRDSGVKDSGSFFPGIGGILDLLDSLLFNAPLMFLYLRLVLFNE